MARTEDRPVKRRTALAQARDQIAKLEEQLGNCQEGSRKKDERIAQLSVELQAATAWLEAFRQLSELSVKTGPRT